MDDLILTGSNLCLSENFEKAMSHELKMANIGLMAKYIGIEVKQMQDGIFILTETEYHIVSIH